jgi:hypothetical protein
VTDEERNEAFVADRFELLESVRVPDTWSSVTANTSPPVRGVRHFVVVTSAAAVLGLVFALGLLVGRHDVADAPTSPDPATTPVAAPAPPSSTRPTDGTTIASEPATDSTAAPTSSVVGSTTVPIPVDDDADTSAVGTSSVLLTSSEDGLFFADMDGTVGERIEVGAATLRSLVDVDQAGRFLILMDGISLTWVEVDIGAVVDIAQFSGLSPIGYRGVWVATADSASSPPVERSWVLATSPDSTSPEWVLPTSEYPIAGGDEWVVAWDREDLGFVAHTRSGSTKFAHGRPVVGTESGVTFVSERSMWSYDAKSGTSRALFSVGDHLPSGTTESGEVWIDGTTVAYLSRGSQSTTVAQFQVFDSDTGEIQFRTEIDKAQSVEWLDATNVLIQGTTISPLIVDIATGATRQLGKPGQQFHPIISVHDR